MKAMLKEKISAIVGQLFSEEIDIQNLPYQVSHPKLESHGDFSSNIAMILAKRLRRSPMDIAEQLAAKLSALAQFKAVNVASPGFINCFLADTAFHESLATVHSRQDDYGRSNLGANESIHIEYVSVNPTGPLHVGHGRNAVYGDVLANALAMNGYQVHREYYVNDAGRQMDILTVSVWVRYLNQLGVGFPFPTNGYLGDYILEIARQLQETFQQRFIVTVGDLTELPKDSEEGGDKESYIDALIDRCRSLLQQDYQLLHRQVLDAVLTEIKDDLSGFGIHQHFCSEQALLDDGVVDTTMDMLRDGGHTYQSEGALWFKSMAFGDEKDRVLVRANGQPTYFATDIANHHHKYLRGFNTMINIFGADHHGYVPRVKASLQALGHDTNQFTVLLVQFATLFRGKEKVSMSTRSGSFITLRALREEVGNDATRFFYCLRKSDQHMEFDIELAKQKSVENPVYYIQYAHARICSVFRQLKEKAMDYSAAQGQASLSLLTTSQEKQLMQDIMRFPEVIQTMATNFDVHHLPQYLSQLANHFHSYYNASAFLVDEASLRHARLYLIAAIRQVMKNGLSLLGVSSPETM